MPQPPNELFRTLADPTHRGIFERLCREGEQTVHALTDQAGVSQPAVSKHLGLLKLAGLVRDRREGRQTDYQRPAPGSGAPDRLDEPPRCLLTRPSRSPIEEDGTADQLAPDARSLVIERVPPHPAERHLAGYHPRPADREMADEQRLTAARWSPVQFSHHAHATLERRDRLLSPGRRTLCEALLQLERFGRRGGEGRQDRGHLHAHAEQRRPFRAQRTVGLPARGRGPLPRRELRRAAVHRGSRAGGRAVALGGPPDARARGRISEDHCPVSSQASARSFSSRPKCFTSAPTK